MNRRNDEKAAKSIGALASTHETRQHGQSMVEMALLLPLLLTLIFAVMEIGRFWGAKHGVTNAAREGARVMLLPHGLGNEFSSAGDVHAAAVRATKIYLNAAGLAHEGPSVEITPVWLDPADGIYGNGNDTLQTGFDTRVVTRGDKVGIKIVYRFETPLPMLLLNGQSPLIIKQVCLLDHE